MFTSFVSGPADFTPLYVGNQSIRTRQVTIVSGANAAGTVLAKGTVLGEIGTTGTFQTAISTATDGSQTPKLILAEDTDASVAAVSGVNAYSEGDFNSSRLTYGAGHTTATVNAAFRESNASIYVYDVGTSA